MSLLDLVAREEVVDDSARAATLHTRGGADDSLP